MKAKCILKIRDKTNNIIGYKLRDQNGNIAAVEPDKLKDAIREHKIEVVNLKLTADNRLINVATKQKLNAYDTRAKRVETLVNKYRTLGVPMNYIETACSEKCIIFDKNLITSDEYVIYIPNGVTKLGENFADSIKNFHSKLVIIGGNDLKDLSYAFEGCFARVLDLSNMNTSNVINMHGMFNQCKSQHIDMSNFDTSQVQDMSSMFLECKTCHLVFESFDTSNVTTMKEMFRESNVRNLDLSSFNTSNVTDMESMFNQCKTKTIDVSSFNTEKVTDMSGMFHNCEIDYIDLSSFNTKNVKDMSCMFWRCKSKKIDVSSFDTRCVNEALCMFGGCETPNLNLSSFKFNDYVNMNGFFDYCKLNLKTSDKRIIRAYSDRDTTQIQFL